MTRTRVAMVTLAVVAGGAALLWVIFAYTPMRQLMPGALRGNLRNQYIETALRLDSLEQTVRMNAAYLDNIAAIMNDELPADSVKALTESQLAVSDSLLAASEAEMLFVQQYRQEERFNLSVLSPIAAEGMVFTSPMPLSVKVTDRTDGAAGIEAHVLGSMPVGAVYRGTVIAVTTAADGTTTVVLQHPNDFISIYSGLGDVYTVRGNKVVAGQRIGRASSSSPLTFELWHNGGALDPREYIAF